MIELGISREDFLRDHFERDLLFCRQACHTDTAAMWRDLNRALFSWDVGDGLIALFREGKVPVEHYTESFQDVGLRRTRIVKDVFYDHMRNGATLVLNRLDTKSLAMRNLTMAVARFVGEKAVANGYVAFGGAGTFAKHWDTHDVFAIQLIGRKRWRVYAPTFPLPLQHQKSKEHKHECSAEPVFDRILVAGDVLYLPRGWWHEAIPLEDEETFHIAVGTHVVSFADYVLWACAQYLPQVFDARKGFKYEAGGQAVIENLVPALQQILVNPENIRAFKQQQLAQERAVSPFSIEGLGRKGLSTLRPDAALSINSAYPVELKGGKVMVNGFSMKVDETSSEGINRLLSAPGQSVRQIANSANPDRIAKTAALMDELLYRDVIVLHD